MRKTYSGPRLAGCLLALNLLALPVVNAQNSYAYGKESRLADKRKGAGHSQEDTNIEKQTLFSVLKELNRTKGIYFLFSDQSMGNKMVNIIIDKSISTEKLLEAILKDTGLKFKKVNDKTFVIIEEKEKTGTNYNPIDFSGETSKSDKSEAVATDPISGKVTTADGAPLEAALGVKGTAKDGMFKATMGRETTASCGCKVGKALGVNTWAAFAGSNDNAVVDGDFAVAETELQPVLKALRGGAINIVAIHSHMTGESPRILFLHYWGRGKAADLAATVRKALDLTAWDGKSKTVT